MMNFTCLPTNLNDSTDTLSKNAKIVYVYGCILQCDSWGILPNAVDLMSYKIGLDRKEVESAINELVKTGHLVLIANDTLIAVEDYVIWNYFKFHKANNKKSQFHKQILQAEQEGKLTQDWHKLPYVAVSKKKQYLKGTYKLVQDEGEVKVESKDSNTKRVVSNSNSTSTTTSDSDLTSSSDSLSSSIPKDWKDVPDTWESTEDKTGLSKEEIDNVFKP